MGPCISVPEGKWTLSGWFGIGLSCTVSTWCFLQTTPTVGCFYEAGIVPPWPTDQVFSLEVWPLVCWEIQIFCKHLENGREELGRASASLRRIVGDGKTGPYMSKKKHLHKLLIFGCEVLAGSFLMFGFPPVHFSWKSLKRERVELCWHGAGGVHPLKTVAFFVSKQHYQWEQTE